MVCVAILRHFPGCNYQKPSDTIGLHWRCDVLKQVLTSKHKNELLIFAVSFRDNTGDMELGWEAGEQVIHQLYEYHFVRYAQMVMIPTKFDPATSKSLPCDWQLMNVAVGGSRSSISQLPIASKRHVGTSSRIKVITVILYFHIRLIVIIQPVHNVRFFITPDNSMSLFLIYSMSNIQFLHNAKSFTFVLCLSCHKSISPANSPKFATRVISSLAALRALRRAICGNYQLFVQTKIQTITLYIYKVLVRREYFMKHLHENCFKISPATMIMTHIVGRMDMEKMRGMLETEKKCNVLSTNLASASARHWRNANSGSSSEICSMAGVAGD
ncbi:hypothetical protein C0J52_05852 [Blattella germanica]|nr:hypothetical protein C0J52_05852 [Blattella germanica]